MKKIMLDLSKLTMEQKLEILKELKDNGTIKSGAFVRLIIKTKKDTFKVQRDNVVEKLSSMVVRLDILYSNTKKFIEQEKDLSPLPIYLRHLEGYEKLLLANNTTNQYYLRAFTTEIKPKSQWYLNGEETTKENIIEKGISSESMLRPSPMKDGIFQVGLDKIIAIEI